MRSIESQRAKLGKSRNSLPRSSAKRGSIPWEITLGVTQLPVAAITLSGKPEGDESSQPGLTTGLMSMSGDDGTIKLRP
jgi:hypothetical protein